MGCDELLDAIWAHIGLVAEGPEREDGVLSLRVRFSA